MEQKRCVIWVQYFEGISAKEKAFLVRHWLKVAYGCLKNSQSGKIGIPIISCPKAAGRRGSFTVKPFEIIDQA